MADMGTMRARIVANIAPLIRSLKKGREAFRTFASKASASLMRVKKAMFNLKTGMAALIGGFTAFFAARAFLRFGVNFERTMSIVQVVSRATRKEMAELRASAKHLGVTTEFTATQAGQALKFLAMAGLTVKQQLKALPQTLNLATAGQIDLARAADISTNIMTQMAIKVEDLTMVNDALTAVQSTANTNIEEAAEAFVFAGAKARGFGVDVFQLSGLIGLLANNGIKASQAGTTLRQSMIRLLTPTTKAWEILKKKNIVIQNTDGTIRNYVDILKDMADAELDIIEITEIFGARAGNIALVLGMGREAMEAYIQKLRDLEGISKTAADVIRNDVQGAIDKLRSALQGAALKAWENYKGAVQTTLEGLTLLVRDNGDKIVKFIDDTLRAIAQKAAGFLDMVQPMIEHLFALLKKAWAAFTSLPKWAQQVGIIAAILGGPKGAVAIVALLAVAEPGIKKLIKAMEDLKAVNKELGPVGLRLVEVMEEMKRVKGQIEGIQAGNWLTKLVASGELKGLKARFEVLRVELLKLVAAFKDQEEGVGTVVEGITKKVEVATKTWTQRLKDFFKAAKFLREQDEALRNAFQEPVPGGFGPFVPPPSTFKVDFSKKDLKELERAFREIVPDMDEIDFEGLERFKEELKRVGEVINQNHELVIMWGDTFADNFARIDGFIIDFQSSFEDAMVEMASTGEFNFRKLAQVAIAEINRIIIRATIMKSLFGENNEGGFLRKAITTIGGTLKNIFTPGVSPFPTDIKGLPGFAAGGSIAAGQTAMVGERGAELFTPKIAGTIIPNNALRAANSNKEIVYQQIINISPGTAEAVRREVNAMRGDLQKDAVKTIMSIKGRGSRMARAV